MIFQINLRLKNSAEYDKVDIDKLTTNNSANNGINIQDPAFSTLTYEKWSHMVNRKKNVHCTLMGKKLASENDKEAFKDAPKAFSYVYRLDPETIVNIY